MHEFLTSGWAPAAAVFVASLTGSSHCVAMCGGILAQCQSSRASLLAYHFGRLIGYVMLGAVVGFFGEQLLRIPAVHWAASALFLGLSATMAFQLLSGRSAFPLLPSWFARLAQKGIRHLLRRAPSQTESAFGIGILTAFLPCGWLSTFLLAALASQHFYQGALILFAFWLGTLPALTVWHAVLARVAPWKNRRPLGAALVLLTIAVSTVWMKIHPLMPGHSSSSPCHHASTPH